MGVVFPVPVPSPGKAAVQRPAQWLKEGVGNREGKWWEGRTLGQTGWGEGWSQVGGQILIPIPGLVNPTRAAWIIASNFAGLDQSTPIGTARLYLE